MPHMLVVKFESSEPNLVGADISVAPEDLYGPVRHALAHGPTEQLHTVGVQSVTIR